MSHLLTWSNHCLFVYFLATNTVSLMLLVISLLSSSRYRARAGVMKLDQVRTSPFTPPITIILPAHNEESTICDSVDAALNLDYPEIRVVAVNDGSIDDTLAKLQDRYQLRPVDLLYVDTLHTAPLRGIYVSPVEPRLVVIDKVAGGSKAGAINAGLNAVTTPYVCVVDADSILERDALLRIMWAIDSEAKNVVAIGGIVRVLNGSILQNGRLREVRLPRRPIEIIQVVEYLRAFLIGREGWGALNSLLIISGAFGVFRTDVLRNIGGFRANAIGEDFDLVVRIHRYMREQGEDYRVAFISDPTCWTQVPSDFKSLARQRARWHKGLLDALLPNRDMLFRSRYGRVGLLMLVYIWIFELMAPVVELIGYTTIIAAAVLGLLDAQFFIAFLIFGYAFGTFISIGAVLLEEFSYKRYSAWGDVAKLVLFCFFEHFPYRQLTLIWALQGILQHFRGDNSWGEIKRTSLASSSSPGIEGIDLEDTV